MSRLVNYYGTWDRPIPPHTGGQKQQLTCNVVIVGGGGAGLSAALRAGELGLRVIVLEKMDELGGNTRLAGGLLCLGSRILGEAGVPDQTEAHINDYRRHHQYRLDPAIYERFLRNTGPYYDWLAEKGLDTENTRVVMDKVVMVRDRETWEPLHNPQYGPGLMGSAVTDCLITRLKELENVTLLTGVCADTLLQAEDGGIHGVTATGNGFDYTIRAENVILASGGFGVNNTLLQKYFPQYFSSDNYFTHYCLKHCTGDGLVMAEAIGAETGKNMSIGLEAMTHIPGAYIFQRIVQEPAGLVINSRGQRFMAEDDLENGEFVLDMQPDGIGWFIITENTKKAFYDLAIAHARYGDWMPEYEQVDKDLAAELGTGLVVTGSTVEELAAAIGADPETLAGTLKAYEEFCARGHDPQFNKSPEHLMPLGPEGPWYGIRLLRKFDVTMGGVSIDGKGRALRPDSTVIPGLYVCGDIASNWMGPEYGPLFSSFAWAVNSGYLAAEECAAARNGL